MTGSHISLFSGVGMTDIAAERLGYKTIATAEIDPWNRKVLAARFPQAAHLTDVRDVTIRDLGLLARQFRRPLMVSGGFPCQDVSAIGTGKGVKDGARSGLWREFARVIREFRPEVVLIENSPMLRSRGLGSVLYDLYSMGYDARWDCIPAAAVGAPHLRDRIFIVAWPKRSMDQYKSFNDDDYIGAVNAPMLGFTEAGKLIAKRRPAYPGMLTRFPRAGALHDGYIAERMPQYTLKAAKALTKVHSVSCPATPTGAWPTPAASLPQDGESPETWLARRAALLNKGINGNGAGMPLSIAVKLWPTPRTAANEWRTTRNAPSHGNGHGKTLAGEVNDTERAEGRVPARPSDSAGNVNPEWVEWLMGLPIGWTDARMRFPYGTAPLSWDREHGIPRTAGDVPDRKKRLAALGNGLVWPCVIEAMKMYHN